MHDLVTDIYEMKFDLRTSTLLQLFYLVDQCVKSGLNQGANIILNLATWRFYVSVDQQS